MNEERQTTEVRETNDVNDNVQRKSVTRTASTSTATVLARIVWFITGFIVILLLVRILLQLLGANQDAGFVDFVYTISNIFAAPFYGIFSYQPTYGKSYLEVSTVVAVLVYLVAGWGVAKLVTITQPRN